MNLLHVGHSSRDGGCPFGQDSLWQVTVVVIGNCVEEWVPTCSLSNWASIKLTQALFLKKNQQFITPWQTAVTTL